MTHDEAIKQLIHARHKVESAHRQLWRTVDSILDSFDHLDFIELRRNPHFVMLMYSAFCQVVSLKEAATKTQDCLGISRSTFYRRLNMAFEEFGGKALTEEEKKIMEEIK